MDNYTVSVSNVFEAECHEDAIMQMVAWLLDNAGQAGYRVLKHEECAYEIFIDAEDIDPSKA